MASNAWSDLHKRYRTQDWIDKPSLFAAQAVEFFPARGKILELGAGLAQDSRFFAEYGYEVTATDIEPTVLDIDQRKVSPDIKDRVSFRQLDIRQPFPFEDESFNVVYAHLSLHYFDRATTTKVFSEITRVLKKGGILAFLVNSTSDPQYGTGPELEQDFYQIDDKNKRFFSTASTAQFTEGYEVKLLDDNGETYKDSMKGVHNLVRFIGKKPEY